MGSPGLVTRLLLSLLRWTSLGRLGGVSGRDTWHADDGITVVAVIVGGIPLSDPIPPRRGVSLDA